jgi:aryl-alcohol dehydrogenase-like predicted oxidoreductase
MRYRKLGSTGVRVSTQCLGTMMFGSLGNADHDDSIAIIRHALDSGINFVDSADVYSRGESETIVGKALQGRREDVILATKFFNPMGKDPNHRGNSRRWIMRAVEDSLRRLDTDYIDLYQAHRNDWTVDLDETLGALTDLLTQGKIRYLGSSSFPAAWIVEAQWTAQRRNRERFVCEQPQYSIFARSAEAEVFPAAQRHHMGVIPWSPLAGGWLTGKYRRDEIPAGARYGEGGAWARMTQARTDDPVSQARFDLLDQLSIVADKAELTLTQLALGFVDAHPAVTSTIIGPRTREQLDSALTASDLTLDSATLDAIDEIVPPGTDVVGIEHSAGDPSLRSTRRRRGAERP